MELIKPLTERAGSSLAAALGRIPKTVDPRTGAPYVSRATVFVSHAWKYNFEELLEALEAHVASVEEPASVYFWLDVFVVNQHTNMDKPKIWWTVTFREAIRSIGETCLVLAPWDGPIPLTRAWCIWEIASVAQTGAHLGISLSPAQAASFEAVLEEDFDRLISSLSHVDVRRAEAFLPSDRDMILRAAEENVGLSLLNELVMGQLREWLVATARRAHAKLPEADVYLSKLHNGLIMLLREQHKLDEAETLCRAALKHTTDAFGTDHPDTYGSMSALAWVLKDKSNLVEAECLFRDALTGRRSCSSLGSQHATALMTVSDLAWVVKDQGRLEDAEALFREAYEGRRETLGEAHPDTLLSLTNLGWIMKDLGNLGAAEGIFRDALAGRRGTLGPCHRDTIMSMTNLGWVVKDQGKLAEAESLFREALESRRACEELGPRHPETWTAMTDLAWIVKDLGRLDESEVLFEAALDGRREALGPCHPGTISSMECLAIILQDQGKSERANALKVQASRAQRRKVV